MRRVFLIACASRKLASKARVREIYDSALFKKSLEYAEKNGADKVFVLSAKHGLIGLEEVIEPYNLTLNKMSKKERIDWAERVLRGLRKEVDLEKDKIVFLAGKNYREYLLPEIKNYSIPLQGLGIGKQLKCLKEALDEPRMQ